MKNLPLLIGTIVGTFILVIGVAVLFSRNTAPETVDTASLTTEARHVKGASEPQVTIVEFADFQCPACAVSAPLAEQVVAQYPDQVQLQFRSYPLTQIHPLAQTAAYAAEAAAIISSDDDSFWLMHDLLFANQTEWSSLTQDEFLEQLGMYAEQLEIDKTQLLETIDSPEVRDRVAADVSLGNSVQIAGTPTFFVNGQRTSAPELLSTVESLLK